MFLAIHPMASASLCCPIRRVVVLVPSGSSKPAASARLSLHFGSRGRAQGLLEVILRASPPLASSPAA